MSVNGEDRCAASTGALQGAHSLLQVTNALLHCATSANTCMDPRLAQLLLTCACANGCC